MNIIFGILKILYFNAMIYFDISYAWSTELIS